MPDADHPGKLTRQRKGIRRTAYHVYMSDQTADGLDRLKVAWELRSKSAAIEMLVAGYLALPDVIETMRENQP